MMKWLTEEGHQCTVITTFPYYPHWKVQPPYEKRSFWYKFENIFINKFQSVNVIRCPHYVPKNPKGVTRLISEFSFFFSAYLVIFLLVFKKKFDYVITVAPPFEIGILGLIYKLFRGGKLLYHIQDLQVDAARDLKMIESKRVINIFLKIEKFIINNSDAVSTISSGMVEKVREKSKKEVLSFPNWVDTKTFHPISTKAELKNDFGFNSTDTVILYAGAIGHKQGLEIILKTAKKLEDETKLKFAICGSGPYKEKLIQLKNEMNLKNVIFLPLQPLNKFNAFLNLADVHLVLQKSGAADLVLPSKLTTILAVGGVAIVTACKRTSLYDIMNNNNMGIVIEPENEDALIAAITNLDPVLCNDMSKRARLYAERNLTRNEILTSYFAQVLSYNKNRSKVVFRNEITKGIESVS